jgi:hypothetical protein
MGLLSSILLAPFTGPWDGTMWTLDKVRRAVEDELTDDSTIKEDLMRLQLELESGDIDDEEYLAREQVIMQRLREVRAWREQLGMSVGGGPVRVARDDDDAR